MRIAMLSGLVAALVGTVAQAQHVQIMSPVELPQPVVSYQSPSTTGYAATTPEPSSLPPSLSYAPESGVATAEWQGSPTADQTLPITPPTALNAQCSCNEAGAPAAQLPATSMFAPVTNVQPIVGSTAVAPVQVYRPAVTVQPAVTTGLYGQPALYVPGQPVRNFLRYVSP